MAANPDQLPVASPSVSAGFAGAGGGTLLALVASSLPEGNALKPWLLWAAPSASVAFSVVWLWLARYATSKMREREVNKLVTTVRLRITEALDDPNISEQHRKNLSADLEALNVITVSRLMDRIKELHVVGTDAPAAPPVPPKPMAVAAE
ncbi:hypothetical protein QMO14_30200 [Variovorax sp. CAN2819]|uniref:hypothetical protein n=1 Tax=Variovorax sp. CAN15 TaxID=3046727 RepID=UPI0026477AB6|nr:hypothetical protein [Variovorax sp. CAN15]MDN6887853.1 hypothetical protein [Variovorax sp. CAN15]